MKLSLIYKLRQGISLKKPKDHYCVRKFLISVLFLFSFTQCYYNPFVFSLLNPPVEEDEKAGVFNLGILAILNSGPKTFSISGIVRDGSGTSQPNKSFLVLSSQSTEPGLDTGGTTNPAGRFLIRVGLGETVIDVREGGGQLVKFTLTINDASSIQVSNIVPSNFDIGSLVFFDPISTPVFFDIISTFPYNNDTNVPFSSLSVTFSENLETVSGSEDAWLTSNLTVTPNDMAFNSTFITNNSLLSMPSSTSFTPYTIQFNSSIKSASGVPLTPYTLKFSTGSPP